MGQSKISQKTTNLSYYTKKHRTWYPDTAGIVWPELWYGDNPRYLQNPNCIFQNFTYCKPLQTQLNASHKVKSKGAQVYLICYM